VQRFQWPNRLYRLLMKSPRVRIHLGDGPFEMTEIRSKGTSLSVDWLGIGRCVISKMELNDQVKRQGRAGSDGLLPSDCEDLPE
jgi:hypothetical protein